MQHPSSCEALDAFQETQHLAAALAMRGLPAGGLLIIVPCSPSPCWQSPSSTNLRPST